MQSSWRTKSYKRIVTGSCPMWGLTSFLLYCSCCETKRCPCLRNLRPRSMGAMLRAGGGWPGHTSSRHHLSQKDPCHQCPPQPRNLYEPRSILQNYQKLWFSFSSDFLLQDLPSLEPRGLAWRTSWSAFSSSPVRRL